MSSLLKTFYIYVLVLTAIYKTVQSCNTTDRFNHQWFGSNCQYKCHCKNNGDCNVTNGDCPNGCDIGWFGPACQYADIAKNATMISSGFTRGGTNITDGDDKTCLKLTETNLSLELTFNFKFYITWLRLVARNKDALHKENLSIKFPDDDTVQQQECVVVVVDNLTMDIYCNISRVIDKMFLNGSALENLCSLYVSQGRNVALKQLTSQTSTQDNSANFFSSNAVDGNPNWNENSCTHTSESSDLAPMWRIYLNHSVTVQAYTIYNRVGFKSYNDAYCCLERLKGFNLTTFDQWNQSIQDYRDSLTSTQEVYYVLPSDPLAPVSKVQIEATYFDKNSNNFKNKVLTLCEVEIFGDSICPTNTYGRDCENVCNCDVPGEKCFVSTGNCPSGCKAGYFGQGCTQTCASGYYGIDCKYNCCGCSNQTCDRVNGNCFSCATEGKKLPNCTQDCDPGRYGVDCRQNCSNNCSQTGSICDVSNGDCISCNAGFYGDKCNLSCPINCENSVCNFTTGHCSSCKSGFYGSDCLLPCFKNCKDNTCEINSGNCLSCNPGFYGTNCTISCPINCKDLVCDVNSGTCISCKSGFQGSWCDEECSNATYGENCSNNCSTNCNETSTEARICDKVNGYCISGCKNEFKGNDCTKSSSTSNGNIEDNENVIIGAVVGSICAVIVVLLFVGGFLILWRRRKRSDKLLDRRPRQKIDTQSDAAWPDHTTSRHEIANNETKNSGVKPTVPKKPTNLKTEDEKSLDEKGTGYYNTVTLDTVSPSTAIALSNLQGYLSSHSKEYFEEQFHNLPINTEATMMVGLSEENKNKNRYKNICAYDHSRVHLEADPKKMHGDYINASYLKGYSHEEKFIASQGPTKIILNDFIRMIWEQKVDKVVMLTNLIEDGKIKCEAYWPDEDEETFGEIRVTLAATQVFADYVIRRLQLFVDSQPMQPVTQFHFTSWPDKGVPDNPWALVDFEQRVAAMATKRPIVVHCSAGVGRTGTFIALRNVMRQAEDTQHMDFFNTVAKLRQDRTMMIQTADQYIFLHEAAKVAMTCINTTITSNNIADRVQLLGRKSVSGKTEMEIEFSAVCSVSEDNNRTSDEEGSAGVMYQNSRTVSNKLKNRFGNILPKDFYRPVLMCESSDMGDYINAVLVPSFRRRDQDIITQLPLPTTVTDFWRLVTQMKVSLIVAFEEHLKDADQTIAEYMPANEGDKVIFPPFQVTMATCHQGSDWIERKLTVIGSKESEDYKLTHLTYRDSATDPNKLLTFITLARAYNPQHEARTLYMCRNGAVFSGLACVLTLLLDRMDNDQRLTVPLVVGAIKTIRPQVIPTVEQYKSLYQVLQRYNETNSVYFNSNYVKLTVLPPDDGKDNLEYEGKGVTEYANTEI